MVPGVLGGRVAARRVGICSRLRRSPCGRSWRADVAARRVTRDESLDQVKSRQAAKASSTCARHRFCADIFSRVSVAASRQAGSVSVSGGGAHRVVRGGARGCGGEEGDQGRKFRLGL
jgi:hypothetical protein